MFADRFCYPLTMFGYQVLIVLSRLLSAHIAHETDTAKIIAAFCRIFYCLHELIRFEFNRLPCSNNKIYNHVVFADRFRYQLTLFPLLYNHISYEKVIYKITTGNWHDADNDL